MHSLTWRWQAVHRALAMRNPFAQRGQKTRGHEPLKPGDGLEGKCRTCVKHPGQLTV